MPTFIVVWLGQVVSLIGSGLTGFSLGIWIYQTSGSTIQFSLIYLCKELPAILVAPLGGAIADRWDKRWLMILSDTGSGICTSIFVILLWLGNLQVWHIYLAMTISSICQGFQEPSYSAIPTILVPKKHFGRSNGMIQLGKAAGQLFSPIVAGILLAKIDISGIVIIDLATFVFALLTLLLAKFPTATRNNENRKINMPLWHEIVTAWNYLIERPGLIMLLLFFVITNFTIGLVQVLITPMVLSFTNAEVLGRILSIGGSGWLIGAITMSIWGGPKKKVQGIFGFELLLGISILIGGLRPSSVLITIAAFTFFFSVPLITGCANTIRQAKVAPELQGRIFAMWGAIAWASFPVAYLVAGPLADYVFQPILMKEGILTKSVGTLIGVGAGRGIGFLFVLVGIFIILATFIAYQNPSIRLIEDELPDAI